MGKLRRTVVVASCFLIHTFVRKSMKTAHNSTTEIEIDRRSIFIHRRSTYMVESMQKWLQCAVGGGRKLINRNQVSKPHL